MLSKGRDLHAQRALKPDPKGVSRFMAVGHGVEFSFIHKGWQDPAPPWRGSPRLPSRLPRLAFHDHGRPDAAGHEAELYAPAAPPAHDRAAGPRGL